MKLQAICSCGSQVQLEDSGTGYTILEKFSTWQLVHRECKSQPKIEPKHEWVGLNWDDLPEIYVGDKAFTHGAKWAEAKLKQKNGIKGEA